jgi:hypothetical protein
MSATSHKLFNMLMASEPEEDEVEELFQDLQYIFSNPFDKAIEDAVKIRQCAYIEMPDQRPS